ncbi:MAG: 5-methylcytosine-specific restriction endonuclease system specificity protein McrC [Atopobiaceae bacterium]|nr:5-methylcytosine-specific restriction endonuclease system specificity protein McrC [Atopobiaceae bacterium]
MIPVRNIYYMLSYGFSALRSQGYRDLETEEFANAADLMAAIVARGIAQQAKRGLAHEYVSVREVTPSPRGKIDMTGSIKDGTFARRRVVCSHDEFSPDTYLNRILRTTGEVLLDEVDDPGRRRDLRCALAYLAGVTPLDPRRIEWRQRYDRTSRTYQMLVNVCHLSVIGALQSQRSGTTRLEDFIDEKRMSALYERFVLEYFKREHSVRMEVSAPYVSWALDGPADELLPIMRTDAMLRDRNGKGTLIIDAKYYGHNTQAWFGKSSIHSGNLYQIFSYVKNESESLARQGDDERVAGMLLYAMTDDALQPECQYRMSGNTIFVKTLDLTRDFAGIAAQLDSIAESVVCGDT